MDQVSTFLYSADIYLMDLIEDKLSYLWHEGPRVQGLVGMVLIFVIIPVYLLAYLQGLLLGPFIIMQMPIQSFLWLVDKSYREQFDPDTTEGRDFIKFYQRMSIIRFDFQVPDDYEVTWKTFLDIWWLQIRLYLTVQWAGLFIPIVFFIGIFI